VLPDGSSMRIPRAWTDADGASTDPQQGDVIFTSGSLRELFALVEALARRP
jgi:hypothetical protein